MALSIGEYQPALEYIREDYEHIREIGKGGFGIVLGAYHIMQEEEHAIKIINLAAVPPEEAKYMSREITLLRKCSHKYILCMIHAFKRENFIFLIMPICQTDMHKIQQSKTPVNQLLKYMTLVCEGVDYLHQKEIVHRDLKPMNVLMLEEEGVYRPQIADFGLAKHVNSGTTSQQFGVYGTIEYMPPEWLMPKRPSDRNSCKGDNWGIGVMVYDILQGNLPFLADSIGFIMSYEFQPLSPGNISWEPFFKSIFCPMEKRLSALQIMEALDARLNPSPGITVAAKPLPKKGYAKPSKPGGDKDPEEIIPKRVTLHKLRAIEEAYPPARLLIGGYKSKNLIIYDFESERIIKRIEIDGTVYFISKLENGYIIIGLGSGNLHYFNPERECVDLSINCREASLYDFAELPGGMIALACGKSEQVEIHEMKGEVKLVKVLSHSGPTIAACYWKLSKCLVTGSNGQTVKIVLWDINTWKISKEYVMEQPVVQIIELRDGRLGITTEGGGLYLLGKEKTMKKLQNASPDAELNAYDKCKNLCEILPNILAYGQKNGTIYIYDIKTETKLTSFNSTLRKITNIKLIGEQFIVTGYKGIKVYDVDDYEELKFIDIKDQAWDVCSYGKGKGVRAKKPKKVVDAKDKGRIAATYPPKNIIQGGFNKKIIVREFESNKVLMEQTVHGNIYVMRQVADDILAIGTSEGKVYMWDIINQVVLRTIETSPGRVFDILRLPQYQMALTCNASDKVEIYDVHKYTKVKEISIEGKPISLCLTPNSHIIIGTESGDLRIFNLSWGEIETRKTSVEGKIVQIITLSDGRLAVSTRGRRVYIWDFMSGNIILLSSKTVDAELGSTTNNKASSLCEIKPGVLIWGEKKYGELTLWDIKTDSKLKSIVNHNRRISAIQLISKTHFIVGTYEHIRVYALADYSEVKSYQCPDDASDFFTYSPSTLKLPDLKAVGDQIAVDRPFPPKYILVGGYSNELFLRDFSTGEIKETIAVKGNTYSIINLSNGHIAIALSTGRIHIWDTNNHKIWKTTETIKEGRVFEIIEISKNRLAAATGKSGVIEIYELESLDRITELKHNEATTTVSNLSKDKLVSGGEDKMVVVWDANTWKMLKWKQLDHSITQVLGLSDGRVAISRYLQTAIQIWDVERDSLVTLTTNIDAQIGTGTANKASNMCEIMDGVLAFGYRVEYGKLQIWDLKDMKEIDDTHHQMSTRRITTIKKYSDEYFLVGTYGSVVAAKVDTREIVNTIESKTQAWNFACYGVCEKATNLLEKKELLPNLIMHGGYNKDLIIRDYNTKEIQFKERLGGRIYSIIDVKNGQAAVGLSNGQIQIWDLSTRKAIRTIQTEGDRVLSVAYIVDNMIAAATGKSKKIEIYNIETGEQITTLAHNGGTTAIITLNNNNLASGSEDRTVKVWNSGNWSKLQEISVEGKVGQLLQLSTGEIAIALRPGRGICIWNMQTGGVKSLPSPGVDAEIGTDTANKATSMCEITSGVLAFGLKTYGEITIWDIQNNTKRYSISTQNKRITKILIIGDKMLTCSYAHMVIYEMNTFTELQRIEAVDDVWDLLPFNA